MIRPALAEEAEAISALALRSKAHWAYPPEQMSVFREELTLSATDVVARRAHVFEEDGEIRGFYTLVARGDGHGDVELDHLFVDPRRMGRGMGSALFEHACSTAQKAGFHRMVIRSDPNAAGFYSARGARLEGYVSSSIPGRDLPFFSLDIKERVAAQPGAADGRGPRVRPERR